MADFVPDDLSHSYIIPRGRCLDVGDLDAIIADHDFCVIINHLVPEILDATKKARDLYNGLSIDEMAPRSQSNKEFTSSFLAAVVKWIQDVVVIIGIF